MPIIGVHESAGRGGYSMQTFSRTMFYPLDPHPEDVHIVDIAHALANICRFGGHAKRFYSVAQHSVLVSRIVQPEDALHGLMHDAAEAYVGDVVRPIKHMPGMAAYHAAEQGVWCAICARFWMDARLPDGVQKADQVALATEMRDVMAGAVHRCNLPDPLSERIVSLPPREAKEMFIARFLELCPEGDR